MNNIKLLEALADIAYYAGYMKFNSGDSRADVSQYIVWALEFVDCQQLTNWDENDYILSIDEFAAKKVQESKSFVKG